MSGGKDSTSIAALAKENLQNDYSDYELQAFTATYEKIGHDEEGYYAGLVAEFLNIPIHYFECDDYKIFDKFDNGYMRSQYLQKSPFRSQQLDFMNKIISNQFNISLNGHGGDMIMIPTSILGMYKSTDISHLFSIIYNFYRDYRSLPPLGIKSRIKKYFNINNFEPFYYNYPAWISQDIADRRSPRRR